MTDETINPDPTPHTIGRANMKAADEAAAEAHKERLGELTGSHSDLLGKVGELRSALASSLSKATDDPQHAAYTESFLRDLHTVLDEKIAWITRHI